MSIYKELFVHGSLLPRRVRVRVKVGSIVKRDKSILQGSQRTKEIPVYLATADFNTLFKHNVTVLLKHDIRAVLNTRGRFGHFDPNGVCINTHMDVPKLMYQFKY